VTVVVAAFMGGLGIGTLVGGRVADRLGPRGSLLAFVFAELLVGLFGLISKSLYYDVLYVRYSHLGATPGVAAVLLFLTLLLPTFFMGLSLPLLARALTSSLSATPRVIGMLYGLNTLGAAAGAFAAPWVLISRFGLERSLWIAAAVNLVCAALATRLTTLGTKLDHASEATVQNATNERSPLGAESLSFRSWVMIYGLTGFIALGLEIAWFRLLGVLLKSTAFTFGTLLAVYLCGLGAGAAVGSRLAARSRRPGTTFLGIQYGLTLYAALSTTALVALLAAGHPIKLVRFLGSYDPVDVYGTVAQIRDFSWSDLGALRSVFDFAILYLGVPAILIGPPTFLMGLSVPFLQKASQTDFARLGRRLGALLATNIAGGVTGAMVVGWLFLPALGTAGTLKALVALGALLVVPFASLRGPESRWATRSVLVAAILITSVTVLAIPDGRSLWARLHATAPAHVLFDEDGAGLSLIKMDPVSATGTSEVYVNGLGQSWIPYGNIHTVLGALPVFIHPAPAEVAVIGLGSGATAFAAAGRAEVQRLVSIEILGAQRQTLERFTRVHGYPGVQAVLSDPRIEHRVGDGRSYIVHSGRAFDIIEADALRPSSTYAGNLYSREYFQLLLQHLRPGGLAVTWAPTERIRATFLSVFAHVLAFQGDVYIGSSATIPFDPKQVAARAFAVHDYYEAAGVDILEVLRPYLASTPRVFGPADNRASTGLNTDMFPRDEFALPFW
jgi:spermidine synthase